MNKIVLAIILILTSLATTRATVDKNSRDLAAQIVARVQRADYEGNRAELKKCYEALTPLLEDKELGSRIRYWRGFDLWRDAINGFNESPVDLNELEQLLMKAADEFKAALAIDPGFVDAKIGIISCLGYVTYIHRKEPERMQQLIAQISPLVKEAKAAAPDNPRLIWVCGPLLWHTPVDKGGGVYKVIESYEKGLEVCSRLKPSTDPLEPSWGKPELLMSLAYTQLTKSPSEIEKAERNAQAALEIVPYWHYARDILMAQIIEAKAKQFKPAS